nr:glycerophosphodiester phosphodiesterase family protein [Sporofaciens musculi]
MAAEENQVSNRLVTQARERGLPVYVWTVSDTDRMKQYLEMGVTGLIGDVPDDIKEVVEEYNQKNGTTMYEWQGEGHPRGESKTRVCRLKRKTRPYLVFFA